jgi:hypothetical protein
MRGAIIFLIVFLAMLLITLGAPGIPPGKGIYNLLGVEEVDRPVLGVPATTLVVAVFNGVVYGIVVWLLFDILGKMTESKGREKRSSTEE